MIMRRRSLLRTAVIGGGAYMAGKSAAQRSAARDNEQDTPQEAAPAATQVPGPRPGEASDDPSGFSQLDELVKMHDRGALTDAEFSAAKARLLG